MKEKITVVKCPNCGYEYLPVELYLPNAFFGRPTNIKRDAKGVITDFSGTGMDTRESYRCDNCDTLFKVFCRPIFMTSVDKSDIFEEEYVTAIHQESLFLDENGPEKDNEEDSGLFSEES